MPFRKPVEPQPLPDIKQSFIEIVDYLESLGVSKTNVRIKEYKTFVENISLDNDEIYSPIQATRLWREIYEIIWVLSTFKEGKYDPPKELLMRALDGKVLEEYTNEKGRNFFLELRAAIYFLRIGYSIELDKECDVIAYKKRERIFIECKRLYSENKSKARIKECFNQLEKRLKLAEGSAKNFGIAWIDPSPAMQQHYFIYIAYSEAGARSAARADLVFFWKKWISRAYTGNDKRIHTIVLQMVWPSWIAESAVIGTGFTSYAMPAHGKLGIFGLIRSRNLMQQLLDIEEV